MLPALSSISPKKALSAPCDSTPSVLTQTWKGLVLEHTVPIGTCAVSAPVATVYALVVAFSTQLKMLFYV